MVFASNGRAATNLQLVELNWNRYSAMDERRVDDDLESVHSFSLEAPIFFFWTPLGALPSSTSPIHRILTSIFSICLGMERETFHVMWELSAPGSDSERCFMRLPQAEYFYDTQTHPNGMEYMPDVRLLSHAGVHSSPFPNSEFYNTKTS